MKKTALVTGAGRRFGFELSKTLLAEGYQLFAHYNSSRDGINELESLGATAVQADFTDIESIQGMIKTIRKATDSIELLVNNASCFFDNETVDK